MNTNVFEAPIFCYINPNLIYFNHRFPIDFGWNEKELIMSIFQIDAAQRPNARDCLNTMFFTKRLVMNSNNLRNVHFVGQKKRRSSTCKFIVWKHRRHLN